LKVEALAIPDVKLVTPAIHGDDARAFSETFNERRLASLGIAMPFVQDNHSLSVPRGVVRGLHFQIAPNAQDKLVRVVRGAILDIGGRHPPRVPDLRETRQGRP
jgi:dTDP-4-dehydrorhamnose 3,5-epimerase